jgi:hypothetical protein
MSTEARGRSIVGAASLRAEPRQNPPGKLGVPHTKIIRATSRQAQCHTRELRSDAGLPERRRSAELGSEKTLTPTFPAADRSVARDAPDGRRHDARQDGDVEGFLDVVEGAVPEGSTRELDVLIA